MEHKDNDILEKIVMKTMVSVDNLAIQVAELNTTLRDNVIDDIKLLKGRADRHRKAIDLILNQHQEEEVEKEHTQKMLRYIYIAITTIAIPVIGLLLGVF